MEYKDKKGNTLYGFSQTQLDKTNVKLNSVVLSLQILIVLFIIMLLGLVAVTGWVAYNNIITRIVSGG